MIDTFILVIPLMLSPGPANLVSFILGARNGFYRTLPFQLGILTVYSAVALALGSLTQEISQMDSRLIPLFQLLGGLFIIYLGFQLLWRKKRKTPEVAPTFASGALLQTLNPKFPGVVLTVFASQTQQHTFVTAIIITVVGGAALFAYSLMGAFFKTDGSASYGFSVLDRIAGVLLCLVGIWISLQPLLTL